MTNDGRYRRHPLGPGYEIVPSSSTIVAGYCSRCNRPTGPKGLEALGAREWACFECGAYHHRDINSAQNILAAGRRRLAVGIPVLPALRVAADKAEGGEDVNPRRRQHRKVGR